LIEAKNLITRYLPQPVIICIKTVKSWFWGAIFKINLFFVKTNHKKALVNAKNKISKNQKIKIVFFVIHESVWKYDDVYKLLLADGKYELFIVIVPYIVYGKQIMLSEMDRAFEYFSDRGFRTIKALSNNDGQWLDIKRVINPDIVFFTNPHNITRKEYCISSWKNSLTCYTQYSFHITHLNFVQYDQLFHNIIWKLFYETPIHMELAKKYARNKAENVVVTGYPGTDIFLNKEYEPKNNWKFRNKAIKRIIWAPHHTILPEDSNLGYSTFLVYYNFFPTMLKKFRGEIQIAFKPHPILKAKLYNYSGWGKKRTDAYYSFWRNCEFGQLEEGEYADLFLTSDALIFDSASFMTEYIYTEKPSLFLVRNNEIINRFNNFGELVFNHIYHARNRKDIGEFIQKIVLLGGDEKKDARLKFKEAFLLPPNNTFASSNIYNYISNQLAKEDK